MKNSNRIHYVLKNSILPLPTPRLLAALGDEHLKCEKQRLVGRADRFHGQHSLQAAGPATGPDRTHRQADRGTGDNLAAAVRLIDEIGPKAAAFSQRRNWHRGSASAGLPGKRGGESLGALGEGEPFRAPLLCQSAQAAARSKDSRP